MVIQNPKLHVHEIFLIGDNTMSITSRLGQAASTIKTTLFNRISTNPNTKSNSNYLDLMYGDSYRTKRHFPDYKRMMKDPQVKVGISILNMFLLSRDLHVTPGGNEDIDKQAAAFLEDVILNDMDTPIRNVRKNIYTALPYGFSAQEVVYKLRDDGNIGIKGMYSIHRKTLDHADTFEFDDATGDLTGINQQMTIGNNETIPIEKVLLYSYDGEFDDPHGSPLLDEIYDNVYEKKQVLKTLAMFIKKHAAPFLLAKLSEDTQQFKKKVVEQLEEVSDGRTNMTVSKDDEVDIMESSNKGEAIFSTIQYEDAIIFRRFFIGTLMMGQMDASGSYAQSESQLSVTRMLLDGVHEEIAGAIQKKLDEFNKWNFAGAKCPNISFEKFEDKDIIGLLNALKPYVDAMAIEPKDDWFQELLGVAVKEMAGVDMPDKDEVDIDEGPQDPESLKPIPGDETSPLQQHLEEMVPSK